MAMQDHDVRLGSSGRVEAPNAGESDVLAVLWAEQEAGGQPLQLKEIFRRVCERRAAQGDAPPASLTTVSTYLRGLVRKGLIEEIGSAKVRSPHTAYRARRSEEEVFHPTMRSIATLHRPAKRLWSILTYAQAADASAEVLGRIRELLEQEEAA